MNRPYVEAEIRELRGNTKIYRMDAPLFQSLDAMRKSGAKYPLSARDLALARIIVKGKKHSIKNDGSWTMAGYLYIKNDSPVRAPISPLLSARLAAAATNVNNGYFSTEDTKIYDKFRKIAEQDKNKDPKDRRAIVLPSRGYTKISNKENPEFFENVFENIGEEYLAFIGQHSIEFLPLGNDTVDKQKGTIFEQEWLRGLRDGSALYGFWGIHDDDALRWAQE